jgi:hypothetical protein
MQIDPQTLIDTATTHGMPAPFWFVELFKVLGFTLHAVPMNLWYAGVLVSMLLWAFGSGHGRRLAGRLMTQMPVVLAFGINLGIVPLLFVQVAYAKVFYPATVLMAWFWFAVVVLLIPAYYGVYLYSFAVRDASRPMSWWRHAAGWLAAILLMAIGFTFANALSLMTNVKGWPGLWEAHSVAGAALGTGLNVADPTLWPRWLMMFGLALTTTGAWVVVDAGWFAGRESDEYRRWARRFALKLDTLGVAWYAIAASWYVFGTLDSDVLKTMFQWPLLPLTCATALAPGLPWLLMLWGLFQSSRGLSQFSSDENGTVPLGRAARGLATLVGLAQFGVLGVNAVSRQIVQNLELGRYWDVSAQPTDVQWGPLAMFLVAFVLGLGLVVWMIAQVVKSAAPPACQGHEKS